MKIEAKALMEVLDRVKNLGAARIESNNILIHREPTSGCLVFAITSRVMHLVVRSELKVETTDSFFFEGAISINFSTLMSVIGGMRDISVDIDFNPTNPNYIQIVSAHERYDMAFTRIENDTVAIIFSIDTSSATTLIDSEPVSELLPLGRIVKNIGYLCVDNQFRTIVHRTGRELKTVFITATTMNVFNHTLADKDTYKQATEAIGFDSKTELVPRALTQVLSCLDDTANITIKYDNTNVIIEFGCGVLRASFIRSADPIDKSIEAYTKMKSIVDILQKNTVTIRVGASGLEELIKKSSALMAKSASTKLTSYVPLYIVSPTEVRVSFKCSAGSYESSISSGVNVEGLPDKYATCQAVFNMSIPMMSSILNTLVLTFGGAKTVIEMKESGEGRIYVVIRSESSGKITYYMRLKK